MLTNNYYKIAAAQSGGSLGSAVAANGSTKTIVGGKTETDISLCFRGGSFLTSIDKGIVCGTGTVEPTVDDYTLSGDAITTLSSQSDTFSTQTHTDGFSVTRTFLLKNTGSEDVTIGEVAWYTKCAQSTGTFVVMVDRTLLETPLTIPAEQVGRLDYTITFKY